MHTYVLTAIATAILASAAAADDLPFGASSIEAAAVRVYLPTSIAAAACPEVDGVIELRAEMRRGDVDTAVDIAEEFDCTLTAATSWGMADAVYPPYVQVRFSFLADIGGHDTEHFPIPLWVHQADLAPMFDDRSMLQLIQDSLKK